MSGAPVAHTVPASQRSSSGCRGMGKGTVWEAQMLSLHHCCLLWPVQSWGARGAGTWGAGGPGSAAGGVRAPARVATQAWVSRGEGARSGRKSTAGGWILSAMAGAVLAGGGSSSLRAGVCVVPAEQLWLPVPGRQTQGTGRGAAAQPLAQPRSGCGGAGPTSCPRSRRRAWTASSRSW